ncbi:MAG: hypothetical protein KKB63_11250 [Alphaproteobacteria bacterium]|nr:hypothetical protein [Alphaproteobacteria bacterium]
MNPAVLGLLKAEERDELRRFIAAEWRDDHAFVTFPPILDWQHLLADRQQYSFVIARIDGRLEGFLGFIPQEQFDPDLAVYRQVFPCSWKIRDTAALTGLGMMLVMWMRQALKPRFIAAIGLTPMVEPIYRAMGYQLGSMDHHVLFDPVRRDYRIAEHVPGDLPRPAPSNLTLVALDEATLMALPASVDACFTGIVPAKSRRHLVHRYLRHPVYRYHLYGVAENGVIAGFLVLREAHAEGASILRLVDLVGPDRLLAAPLLDLLRDSGAEYVDFYSHGVDPAALAAAGFLDRHATPGLTAPHYFEPYARANQEIAYTWKQFGEAQGRVRLARGDSDQDRPNLISGGTA